MIVHPNNIFKEVANTKPFERFSFLRLGEEVSGFHFFMFQVSLCSIWLDGWRKMDNGYIPLNSAMLEMKSSFFFFLNQYNLSI